MIELHAFSAPPAPPLRDGPPAAFFGAAAAAVLLLVVLEDARFLTPGYPPLPKLPPDFLYGPRFFGAEDSALGALFDPVALAALALWVCVRMLLNSATSASTGWVK